MFDRTKASNTDLEPLWLVIKPFAFILFADFALNLDWMKSQKKCIMSIMLFNVNMYITWKKNKILKISEINTIWYNFHNVFKKFHGIIFSLHLEQRDAISWIQSHLHSFTSFDFINIDLFLHLLLMYFPFNKRQRAVRDGNRRRERRRPAEPQCKCAEGSTQHDERVYIHRAEETLTLSASEVMPCGSQH